MQRQPDQVALADSDPVAALAYCRAMLPRVSRTFALNIALLRGTLGDAVLVAYLLCRIADTVEDAPQLAPDRRPILLAAYRDLLPLREGWQAAVQAWSTGFAPISAHGADLELCANAPALFTAFATLPAAYQQPVEECVGEMATGMRAFALRRAAAPDGRLRLETVAELEEYCHYVAGTVGLMLCRLFALSSPALDFVRLERMRSLAGRFGLALQLTNIVKDVAEDARRGAFYVPRALALRHRVQPEDLLDPSHRPAARAVVRELVALAASALDGAVAFTLLIPRREARLRLFCLWPIFLAAGTLRRARDDDSLFLPGSRARLRHGEVRRWLGASTLVAPSNHAIRGLYARARLGLDAGNARI
jgi:farnesyl-diphosphate farnesyltransferase